MRNFKNKKQKVDNCLLVETGKIRSTTTTRGGGLKGYLEGTLVNVLR
jgi:hypothetical protein